MPVTLEQVVKDARSLLPGERSQLVSALIRDLEPGEPASAQDIETAWDAEISRRVEDLTSGKVKPIPADEVFARVRARLDEAR